MQTKQKESTQSRNNERRDQIKCSLAKIHTDRGNKSLATNYNYMIVEPRIELGNSSDNGPSGKYATNGGSSADGSRDSKICMHYFRRPPGVCLFFVTLVRTTRFFKKLRIQKWVLLQQDLLIQTPLLPEPSPTAFPFIFGVAHKLPDFFYLSLTASPMTKILFFF